MQIPYVKVWLPNDEVAKSIIKRAVFLRSVIKLIGEAETVEKLTLVQNNEELVKYAGEPFKLKVDMVDKKMRRDKKIKIMEQLDLEALKPHQISLENAKNVFSVLIDAKRNKVFFGKQIAKARIS